MKERKKDNKKAIKKAYISPKIEKHRALSVVSGTGCNSYNSRTTAYSYYY